MAKRNFCVYVYVGTSHNFQFIFSCLLVFSTPKFTFICAITKLLLYLVLDKIQEGHNKLAAQSLSVVFITGKAHVGSGWRRSCQRTSLGWAPGLRLQCEGHPWGDAGVTPGSRAGLSLHKPEGPCVLGAAPT